MVVIHVLIASHTVIYDIRRVVIRWYSKSYDSMLQFDNRYCHGLINRSVGYLIPLFYAAILAYTISNFFGHCFHLLPEPLKNSYFHSLYIVNTIVALVISTYLAVFSDPGEITPSNIQSANAFFVNNQIIFFRDNNCATCEAKYGQPFAKPARSKHCSLCNRCVTLFDHHCIWINNCVGYNNYRWFMFFLVANLNFLLYGGYLNFRIFRPQMDALREEDLSLWKKWTTTLYKNYDNKMSGIFLILCVIFFFLTSLFFLEHVRYLYLGVTTNELGKWQDVQYLIGKNSLYRLKDTSIGYMNNEDVFEKALVFNKINNVYDSVFLSMKNEQILPLKETNLVKINDINEIDNVYDIGFVNNVKYRLIPKQL